MKKKIIAKSEFDFYKKIIQGELRPHLPQNSNEEIKKLLDRPLFKGVITPEVFDTKEFREKSKEVIKKLRLLPGDQIHLREEEVDGVIHLHTEKVVQPELKELFDLDHPFPAPDLRAEYYEELIEEEFYRIECSSKEMPEIASSEEELSFYARRNVQILKALCVDAHLLSKKLGTLRYDRDRWDTSYGWIMHILKLHLIRSILHFQFLFKSYLNENWNTEEDWRFELFEEMPFRFSQRFLEISRDMEERRKQRGLPPSNNNPFPGTIDPDDFDGFIKKHPDKFIRRKKEGYDSNENLSDKGKNSIIIPIEVRKMIQELKDKEGGKGLAVRWNISERTLYDVIKGNAAAITLRRISKADPQFAELAELAQ